MIPDGGTGIIFNYGSPFCVVWGEGYIVVRGERFFSGVMPDAFHLKFRGGVDAAGVRFLPGVHSILFKGMPINKFTDTFLDMDETGFAEGLYHKLEDAEHIKRREMSRLYNY